MAQSLASLRSQTLIRMGDPNAAIWTGTETDLHLRNAYQQIAVSLPVFPDWIYLENLPSSFSYNNPWEKPYLDDLAQGFDNGCANFTMDDDLERRFNDDEAHMSGPASYTSSCDRDFLVACGGSGAISATVDIGDDAVIAITRGVWDRRGIDALHTRQMAEIDSRYQLTTGEVYGFLWQQDGLRTVRKVRVPAQQADTWTVTGSWGILRSCADITSDTVTGTWGSPRRIATQYAMSTEYFGIPRRSYRDGKNVRFEVLRQGRPMDEDADLCELPDRYADYLVDYAQAKMALRKGPGQDRALSEYFQARWTRHLARLKRRMTRVSTQRAGVFGGGNDRSVRRPGRPVMPWAYGSVVRR